MLDVRIVLDDVPEYVFKACGATTQDERDTISACVRTYARDCIAATLLTIEDGPVFKDALRWPRIDAPGAPAAIYRHKSASQPALNAAEAAHPESHCLATQAANAWARIGWCSTSLHEL